MFPTVVILTCLGCQQCTSRNRARHQRRNYLAALRETWSWCHWGLILQSPRNYQQVREVWQDVPGYARTPQSSNNPRGVKLARCKVMELYLHCSCHGTQWTLVHLPAHLPLGFHEAQGCRKLQYYGTSVKICVGKLLALTAWHCSTPSLKCESESDEYNCESEHYCTCEVCSWNELTVYSGESWLL